MANQNVKFLSFPYLLAKEGTDECERCWAHMTFKTADGSTVDRRVIKKVVRKWVKINLGRSIHPRELHKLLKRVT